MRTTRSVYPAILLSAVLAFLPARVWAAAAIPVAASQDRNRLFRSYERESAPYFPFTASENGDHAYDGVLANNLSNEYRTGLARLGTAYLKQLHSISKETLDFQQRLSYEIFEYNGLADLPGGREMYLSAVRRSTTTDLPPARIYDVGTAEVERIKSVIKALRAEIAASQDIALTRYRSAEDLLRGYGDLRNAVTAALPRLFGRFPRADFEIRPIEAFREKSMPSSYVAPSIDGTRPGVFYLNTSALKTRGDAAVARSLFLHEAVPGHHFQVALQRENADLQVFRKFGWYNAFGEGWALYAEGLGEELGVYQNRRDRLGMLNDELFRAARLVVDVGIHEKGWTRQQAIDYMRQNIGVSSEGAEREVERYMAWPGQALSYKIGQLKILEIRNRAEQKLRTAFDIRAFHDELLKDGAMPLSILEAKMDRWIASQQPKPE